MIATYRQKEYYYNSNSRFKRIFTRLKEKTDETYIYNGHSYYKDIEDEELEDIFVIDIYVKYESGFENVHDWWPVTLSSDSFKDETVLLYFNGSLPNWHDEEKALCSSYIPLADLSGGKVIYKYKKKNNQVCTPTQKVEIDMPVYELIKFVRHYDKRNL